MSRAGLRAPAIGLAAASLLALLVAGPASAEDGEWGVRFLPDDDPPARIELRLAPGESTRASVVVVNRDATELRLELSGTGADYSETGAAQRVPDAPTADWIVPSATELAVGPQAEVEAGFGVVVPDAAAPGRYVGALALRQAPVAPIGSGAVPVERELLVFVHVEVTGETVGGFAPLLAVLAILAGVAALVIVLLLIVRRRPAPPTASG